MAIPTERRKYFQSSRIKTDSNKKFGLKAEDLYKPREKKESSGSTSAAQSMADWSSMNDAYKDDKGKSKTIKVGAARKGKTRTTSYGVEIPESAVSKNGDGYAKNDSSRIGRRTGGGSKSFGASGDTSSRSRSFGSSRDTGGGKKAFG